jgi:tol-pal system protein YbgF
MIYLGLMYVSFLILGTPARAQSPDSDIEAVQRKLDAAKQAQSAKDAAAKREADQQAETQAAERRQRDAISAADARKATMIIKSDTRCELIVNGEAYGWLQADVTQKMKVDAGEQLIECDARDGRKIELTEEIDSGKQSVVRLTLPVGPAEDIGSDKQLGVRTGLPANPVGEKLAYDAAFEALKNGRYAESSQLFGSYLRQHPNGEYAANATYWLGETYYITQNFQIAFELFQSLVSRFPDSSKVPDALLRVGYCQEALGDTEAAARTLSDVVSRYADTPVARLAQGRLRALRESGQ